MTSFGKKLISRVSLLRRRQSRIQGPIPSSFVPKRKISWKKFAASALVGIAIIGPAHKFYEHLRYSKPKAEYVYTHKTPAINFFYCEHHPDYFNMKGFSESLALAVKSGRPFNTILFENSDISSQRKLILEKRMDKNTTRLAKLAEEYCKDFSNNTPSAINKRNKIIALTQKILQDPDPIRTISTLYAYSVGVRRVRYIESYSPEELRSKGRSIVYAGNEAQRNYYPNAEVIKDPIKYIQETALHIKFRNERIAKTIIDIERRSNSDPFFRKQRMNAIVLIGSAHGGNSATSGVHNIVAKNSGLEVYANVEHAELNRGSDFNTYLIEEASRLAEMSEKEIQNYSLENFRRELKRKGYVK